MSSPNQPDLSAKQQAVIDAIAAGATITATARATGVHRSTIYDWLQTTPTFAASVAAARQERSAFVEDLLRDTGIQSLLTIQSVLTDPQATPSTRLRAAALALKQNKGVIDATVFPQPIEEQLRIQARDADPNASQVAALELLLAEHRLALAQSVKSDTISGFPAALPPLDPEYLSLLAEWNPTDPPQAAEQLKPAVSRKVPRNALCPCGSRLKYKRCCGRPSSQPARAA